MNNPMHKKLIALALASLASGTALAQSNVTIYGIMDVGYGYYSDAPDDNVDAKSAIDSGQWKTSRFGFKGSEDLGEGLVAGFQMEFKAVPDYSAAVESRNSWVSLKIANLGEVKVGSVASFHDDLLGATSVMFGNNTVASPKYVYILTTGSKETTDLKNAIAYYSPSWSGFQAKLGFSSHADTGTNDVTPTGLTGATGNERVYTVAGHYANGPLVAGLTYENNKYQSYDGAPSIDSGNEWHLAAAYNFGIVRVSGAYGVTGYAQNPGVTKDKRAQWQLGASTPIGAKGTLAANYARANIEYNTDADDDKVSFWGIGYQHSLSKRTNLYVAYGDISQNESNLVKSRLDGGTTTGDTGYQSAFNVGVRHDF